MSSSPEAGPSASYDYNDQPTQTQMTHMPLPRKKARMSQQAIFDQPDVKEKQKLGLAIKGLKSKLDDDRANVKNLNIEDFKKAIDDQDSVFQKVQDTESGALEARVFSSRIDLVHIWSKQQNQNTTSFDTDEFFVQLKSLLRLNRRMNEDDDDDREVSDEDELDEDTGGRSRKRRRIEGHKEISVLGDWEKVGWMAAKLCRRVPGMEFMYGPLSVEHKKRTMAARAKKAPLAPEQKPEELVQGEGARKESDTPAWVKKVFKNLAQVDPANAGLNFFKFAINPHSFGQSVENIFYISFLIRDAKVGLDVMPDGELIIRRRYMGGEGDDEDEEDDEEAAATKRRSGLGHQGVMEFDLETWEMAKDTFDITECLIPNRKAIHTGGPGDKAWY